MRRSPAWKFDTMADAYGARPAYPAALLEQIVALTDSRSARIVDVGAGLGHVALPLAARGFAVTALEPAQAMLAGLQLTAAARGLAVTAVRAAAEALPLAAASAELVIVADALHFLDVEQTARELDRVLVPDGALALVTCEPANTPFMSALVSLMEHAAPRRPRALASPARQLFALTGVPFGDEQRFEDATPVDERTLEQILRSISFIGPAMSPQLFAAFFERVLLLPQERVWARAFTLRAGRRGRARGATR